MQPRRKQLVTEAEFLAGPGTLERVELIDGEVIVSPAPTYWHQEILRRLLLELALWARAQPGPVTIGQSPLDVRFGPARILQPDAFVLFAAVGRDHQGPIDRAPELCVEVLSIDRVYDRVTKRFLYAAAGVREYWVVETAGIIERWYGDALAEVEEVRGRLVTPLLPGFELDLAALFA